MVLKRALLVIGMALLCAGTLFAQDQAPTAPVLAKEFLVALLAGVPLLVAIGQLLRRIPVAPAIPGWLKAILPSAFGVIAAYVSNWAGVTVDLSPILGALLGTASNAAFDLMKEIGAVRSSSST